MKSNIEDAEEIHLQVHPAISADSHQLLGLHATNEVMQACKRLQSTETPVAEMFGIAYLLDIYLSAECYPSSITQGADLRNNRKFSTALNVF